MLRELPVYALGPRQLELLSGAASPKPGWLRRTLPEKAAGVVAARCTAVLTAQGGRARRGGQQGQHALALPVRWGLCVWCSGGPGPFPVWKGCSLSVLFKNGSGFCHEC